MIAIKIGNDYKILIGYQNAVKKAKIPNHL